jgi:hypothetical protein
MLIRTIRFLHWIFSEALVVGSVNPDISFHTPSNKEYTTPCVGLHVYFPAVLTPTYQEQLGKKWAHKAEHARLTQRAWARAWYHDSVLISLIEILLERMAQWRMVSRLHDLNMINLGVRLHDA